MVWRRANGPQQYIKILKEATIKATRLRILRAKKPIVKGVKAKPKILIEEDIKADSIIGQVV